jgi:hypothetical protein
LAPKPDQPFEPENWTRGGGWGFAVGAGIEYENAYAGSDDEFQYFGSEVRASPIAREDFALEFELAVLFTF